MLHRSVEGAADAGGPKPAQLLQFRALPGEPPRLLRAGHLHGHRDVLRAAQPWGPRGVRPLRVRGRLAHGRREGGV